MERLMKCSNCGFELDGSAVCPICGTENAQQVADSAARDNSASDSFGGAGGFENFNPYQTSVQNGSPYQNTPARANYSGAPVRPQPTYPNPQAQMNPAYPNPQAQPAPAPTAAKSNGSAAAIVLGTLVAIVVTAGIAISIFSAVLSNTTFIDSMLQSSEPPVDYGNDINPEYSNNTFLPVGEAFEFPDGEVELMRAEKTDQSASKGKSVYAFTVKITNSADSNRRFDFDLTSDFSLYDKNGTDLYYDLDSSDKDYMEYLYFDSDEEYDDYSAYLKPGEAAEITYYYRGSGEIQEVFPSFSFVSFYGSDTYSVTANFKAELNSGGEATPSER